MECAPVLMIGFNRPDLTKGLLDCVRRARPTKLYFAVDGPRKGRQDDVVAVAQVQNIAKEVDWPCDVKTLFRTENLGCGLAVSEAITWFFSEVPYGIILEDDCHPVEFFFEFESELLELYKDDERIGIVSGTNHYGFQTNRGDTYHFTSHADIWGWGSWARVWKYYSFDISQTYMRIDEIARRFTGNRRMRKRFIAYAQDAMIRKSTWDVQLAVMIADRGLLCVTPKKRLVSNLGFGDLRGSHTQGYCFDDVYSKDIWLGEKINHPIEVSKDANAVKKTEKRMCGVLPRGLTYMGAKVPIIRPLLSTIGVMLEKLFPMLFQI